MGDTDLSFPSGLSVLSRRSAHSELLPGTGLMCNDYDSFICANVTDQAAVGNRFMPTRVVVLRPI
jgi:hypothetical protein